MKKVKNQEITGKITAPVLQSNRESAYDEALERQKLQQLCISILSQMKSWHMKTPIFPQNNWSSMCLTTTNKEGTNLNNSPETSIVTKEEPQYGKNNQ